MNSKYFLILLVVSTLLITELVLMNFRQSVSSEVNSFLYKSEFRPPPLEALRGPQCKHSNMLKRMTQGRWILTQFKERQKRKLEAALEYVWTRYSIPSFLQRKDGLCGNATFKGPNYMRALCDPYGSLPCCYRNKCTLKDVESCRCEDCYDVRQAIHAELAEWIPTDPATRIYYFQGHKDSCMHLKNMTVYMIGDSYLRHAYASMLSLLNSDKKYGPLRNTTSPQTIALCKDLTLYTATCKYTVERAFALPCNQTVEIKYVELFMSRELNKSINILKSLETRPNSWMIIGIGVHENYHSGYLISKFLKPLLENKKKSNSTWPKIIWSAAHAPGLLKSPRYPQQHRKNTLEYNAKLQEVLDGDNIPTFNSFQLTDNVVSFDGTHYGKGVNDIKAQILLNYLACQNINL